MKYIFSIGLLFRVCICYSQEKTWDQSKNWKLYYLKDKEGLSYPIDSLSHFKYVVLRDDSMHFFLKYAEIWPKEKYSMWMGSYTASCEAQGVEKKIDVSVYGGFFFDESTKRYYELPDNLKDQWIDYFDRKTTELSYRLW